MLRYNYVTPQAVCPALPEAVVSNPFSSIEDRCYRERGILRI